MNTTLRNTIIVLAIVLVVIVAAGIYKFSYLSGKSGYDVDGNKIEAKNDAISDENEAIIASIREEQRKVSKQGKAIEIKERLEVAHEGRSLFIAEYPRLSNSEMEKTVKEFVDTMYKDFMKLAAENEVGYAGLRDSSGAMPRTAITHRYITFEAPHFTTKLKIVRFIVGENTGGTGSSENRIFAFDGDGKRILMDELFVNKVAALKVLSEKARRQLLLEAKKSFTEDLNNPEFKEIYKGICAAVIEGTKPAMENFKAIAFDEQQNLTIYFDKYQVASGAEGVKEVKIPIKEIEKVLNPRVLELLK